MDLIEFFLLCVENHQLTLREVCRVVGFRSYNQLARLLQHKTSPMKVLEFGQLLLDHASQLRLTAEECQSIRDCMFPLLKGKENVYAFEHFFSLITTLQVEAAFPNADLLLMDMQGHPAGSLRKLLSNADSAEISVINCIHSNVLRIIASCVHDVNLSVNYYYCEAQSISSSVDAVCDIWPYLFCEWLHPYSVRAATHQGLWTGDVIFVHLAHQKAPNSTIFEDFEIVLYSKETAIAIPLPNPPELLLCHNDIDIHGLFIQPYGKMEEYKEYLLFAYNLEHQHRFFRIKPDIGLELIHPEIQVAALGDDVFGSGNQQMVNDLISIERKRYEESASKYQRQCHIVSYDAMQEFVKTGKTADHFYGFRAYTPSERLFILRDIYQRMKESSFFRFWFLLPDVHFTSAEVVRYEEYGVSILMPNTIYDLNGSHKEIFIRDRTFCDWFSKYFREYLCRHYIHSSAQSIKMMERLIEQCTELL